MIAWIPDIELCIRYRFMTWPCVTSPCWPTLPCCLHLSLTITAFQFARDCLSLVTIPTVALPGQGLFNRLVSRWAFTWQRYQCILIQTAMVKDAIPHMNPCRGEITVHVMSCLLVCYRLPSILVSKSPRKFEKIIFAQGQVTGFLMELFSPIQWCLKINFVIFFTPEKKKKENKYWNKMQIVGLKHHIWNNRSC